MARKRTTDGEGGERLDEASVAPPDERPAEDETPRARTDELDRAIEALVPRQGTPMGRGEVLLVLADTNEAAHRMDVRQAEDRYLVGEKLVHLLSHGAHLVLGDGTMGRFVKVRFKLGRTWAFESMRVAKYCTREDVKGLEWTVVELGVDVAQAMGLKSLGALKQKALPVPGPDGDLAYFPTSAEHLEACLKALAPAPKTPEPEPEPTAAEHRTLRRAQAVYAECREKFPAVDEATLRLFMHGGAARMSVGSLALRSEAFDAVTRTLAELRKALAPGADK